jgi:hypothetical protein
MYQKISYLDRNLNILKRIDYYIFIHENQLQYILIYSGILHAMMTKMSIKFSALSIYFPAFCQIISLILITLANYNPSALSRFSWRRLLKMRFLPHVSFSVSTFSPFFPLQSTIKSKHPMNYCTQRYILH